KDRFLGGALGNANSAKISRVLMRASIAASTSGVGQQSGTPAYVRGMIVRSAPKEEGGRMKDEKDRPPVHPSSFLLHPLLIALVQRRFVLHAERHRGPAPLLLVALPLRPLRAARHQRLAHEPVAVTVGRLEEHEGVEDLVPPQ